MEYLGENKHENSRTVQKDAEGKSSPKTIYLTDNRPASIQKKAFQAGSGIDVPVSSAKTNNTGLPDSLKSGVENLSGISMDDVKVHYNSPKPAQLQAHAYAQGNQIHLALGQEKHLPHEAWHVVQQKQGRVKATMQMKSGVNVNNDKRLESEADEMGRQIKSLRDDRANNGSVQSVVNTLPLIQRKKILNLASGTNIANLKHPKPGSGDEVLNVDRGDMLAMKMILDHYEEFERYGVDVSIDDEAARTLAINRLGGSFKEKQDKGVEFSAGEEATIDEQIKKEKANKWFYKDEGISSLAQFEAIIRDSADLSAEFARRKAAIQSQKGFAFGAVSGNMPLADGTYDEIHMVSGFGIPLFKDESLLREMYRLLKPGGSIVLTGNKPVLKSIGLNVEDTYSGHRLHLSPLIEQYFEVEDWGVKNAAEVGSEHTVGGKFNDQDEFHELWFKKKS